MMKFVFITNYKQHVVIKKKKNLKNVDSKKRKKNGKFGKKLINEVWKRKKIRRFQKCKERF